MPIEHDRILILTEQEAGHSVPLAFELLGAGRKLAEEQGAIVCACTLGHGITNLLDEIAWYADEVYVLDHPLLASFQADLYASALEDLCHALEPGTIIMGYTYDNFELAPKVACRMRSELITDCIAVERDAATGHLLCTKPVYGSNAVAVFELDSKPWIVTLRPKVYEALARGHSKGQVIPFECDLQPSFALTESVSIVEEQSVSLDMAEAIVAGGRGVSTSEGIEELKHLIDALKKYFGKVELGASRPLVDAGVLPRSRQIGQTGERVSPDLYVAVAISGASQHLSGMVGSRKIVAINRNGEAPIFDVADYGVVAPFEEVMPSLIRQLEALA